MENSPEENITTSTASRPDPATTTPLQQLWNEAREILYSMGFAAKEHIALAEKLLATPPKDRFERVILASKHAEREHHLEVLRKLVKTVRQLDEALDARYFTLQRSLNRPNPQKPAVPNPSQDTQALEQRLQRLFPRFAFQSKILDEMAFVGDNIADKLQVSLKALEESPEGSKAARAGAGRLCSLEQFTRMPAREFLAAQARLDALLDEITPLAWGFNRKLPIMDRRKVQCEFHDAEAGNGAVKCPACGKAWLTLRHGDADLVEQTECSHLRFAIEPDGTGIRYYNGFTAEDMAAAAEPGARWLSPDLGGKTLEQFICDHRGEEKLMRRIQSRALDTWLEFAPHDPGSGPVPPVQFGAKLAP